MVKEEERLIKLGNRWSENRYGIMLIAWENGVFFYFATLHILLALRRGDLSYHAHIPCHEIFLVDN